MALLNGDPLTQTAFSIYENKGVFAVLIGSGLSRAAEIPTGWEITVDLVRRVGIAQGVEEQTDWAAWYREKTGEEPNYSTLLEELASSPDERRAILHSYIEPNEQDREEGRKLPTNAHKAIADLVAAGYVRVLITTNFDRLMENSLRERGIEPTVVSSVDALSGAEPLTHSKCYLLKLHGDYKDARILNTEAELGAYPAPYDALLDRILDEHGLIVCGWSGEWDHALRAAFLRAPNRRYSTFWAARGALGAGASQLVDHRRARVIPISGADSFFSSLWQRVETLEQSQRQNPLSIDLLVSSAKRYLAKPEYRIQLDDLFSSETERLIGRLNTEEFATPNQWSQEIFRQRVKLYESTTESLACMAGILGRWGENAELPIALDIVRTLYAHAQNNGGGITHYLNLRSYPAVLVFTAYALGLTRAERWKQLRRLMNAETPKLRHGQPTRLAETLFLSEWEGAENNVWQNIEGLDRHKTALSDHLLEIFTEWAKRFAGLTPDFELMFERFEIIGSLVHIERTSKAELQLSLSGPPQNSWTWTPFGRSSWHTSNSSKVIDELQNGVLRKQLVDAGFAASDEEYVDAFIQNFQRICARMRW